MQYSRWGDWSYNKHNNNSYNKICSVTNNEGKQMLLKSITLHLGIAASGTSANWGNSVTGNGGSVSFYLSTSYNSAANASDTKTISSPKKSTYTNSAGTLRTYYTDNLPQVTFSFGDGILMNSGTTLNFYFVRTSGDNVLLCPYEGSKWDGYQYSTQNVSGYATDPYTPASTSINGITPSYGIVGETSFTANYNITKGTNNISWTNVRLDDTNGNLVKDYDLGKTSTGSNITGSFKLGTDKFSDGQQYKGSIRIYDGKNYFETDQKNIYTYRTPKISGVSLSPSSFSGTGNSTLYWTTNGRRWTTANEADFTTSFKFNTNGTVINSSNSNPNTGDTTNTSSQQSQGITSTIINNSFTATQRSQEKITTTVTVTRKNPTSGKTASSTSGNITIQFWPKYSISTLSYTDPTNGNSISAGSTNYIDVLPNIRANWTYTSAADRGIIDGFVIRIYRADKTTQVGSNYYAGASDTYKDFDVKTQLKRGELNYIKITPYYNLPSGGTQEGPGTIQSFILPLGRIRKPTIDYPNNNSTWHNKNFRILLQCPVDDDFDTYGIAKEDYRYEDIELYIEGPNFNATYSYKKNGTIFSSAGIYHERKIIINPSIITSFPDLSYYKFKIRFQKKYYQNTWSEWSNTIQVNKSNITELGIKQYEKVLQSEYKTVRDYSIRLWNVYFKSTESYDSNNKAQSKGDIIYAKQYLGIYNTILAIQNRVNGWGSFDDNRSNVKFNQSITNLSGSLVPTKGELITAAKVSSEPVGRNYKNILIECMNKLY